MCVNRYVIPSFFGFVRESESGVLTGYRSATVSRAVVLLLQQTGHYRPRYPHAERLRGGHQSRNGED